MIGAGIVGVCVALALRRRGLAVTVLDPNAPGSQTSFGNAGGFGVTEVMPLAAPGVWRRVPAWLRDPLGPLSIRPDFALQMLPWLWHFARAGQMARVEAISHALAALLRPTFLDYQPLLRDAGVADTVVSQGALTVYHDRRGYARDALEWRIKRARGINCEELDARALHDLEPALAPFAGFGVFTPEWRHTRDPHRIVTAFAELLQREGGVVRRARACGFEVRDGACHAVLTEGGGRMACAHIVIAAGVWSGALVKGLEGHGVPLVAERGYNTTLADPGIEVTREVIFADDRFVITPMSRGLRIGGAAEFARIDAPPDFARADALLQLGRRWVPGLRAGEGQQWMGQRPATPDSLPVIGRSPRHANVYYAFGHGHLGLTQGATPGRLIAELVHACPSDIDLAPYGLERFSARHRLRRPSRE